MLERSRLVLVEPIRLGEVPLRSLRLIGGASVNIRVALSYEDAPCSSTSSPTAIAASAYMTG